MTKKDINFIKLTRKVAKQKEQKDQCLRNYRERKRIEALALSKTIDQEILHTQRCKEAAKMSPRERLMNYAATMDGTYIGVGCDWDLLTKLGKNQMFGGL
jgi:hypothetical protein